MIFLKITNFNHQGKSGDSSSLGGGSLVQTPLEAHWVYKPNLVISESRFEINFGWEGISYLALGYIWDSI